MKKENLGLVMVSIHFINKVFQMSTVIWATFEGVATLYKETTSSQGKNQIIV